MSRLSKHGERSSLVLLDVASLPKSNLAGECPENGAMHQPALASVFNLSPKVWTPDVSQALLHLRHRNDAFAPACQLFSANNPSVASTCAMLIKSAARVGLVLEPFWEHAYMSNVKCLPRAG